MEKTDNDKKKTKETGQNKIDNTFRTVLQSMDDLVFAFDADMHFIFYHTPEYSDLFLPPETFLQKKFSDVMPPYLTKMFTNSFIKCKKGEIDIIEYYLNIDNRERWFTAKLSPILNEGNFEGVVAVIRETTQQKNLETNLLTSIEELKAANQQLSASEQQLIALNNELKKVNDEIVKNRALLHSILESPHGMIIFSLDKNYCYTAFTILHKQIMKKIWGVDIKTGMNMLDIISYPEDRKRAKKNFDKALNGESLTLIEEYGDEKLNRSFWENRYAPVYDDKKNIVGVSVFVIDITERMETQMKMEALNQQLTANEQQLRAANQQLTASEQQLLANEQALRKEKEFSENIIENANSMIIVLDSNANIVVFNKFAEELTGYLKKEVLNKNWFDYFITEKKDDVREVFNELINKRPIKYNFTNNITCKDGSVRTISWANTVLKSKDKTDIKILSIGNDITKRLEALQEVKRLSKVVETTQQNIVITTIEGTVVYVNEAYLIKSGFKENEILGRSMFEFSNEEGIKILREDTIPALLQKGHWQGEMSVKTKHGKIFPADLVCTLLTDDNNNPEYFVAVFTDISERKRREEIQNIIYNITTTANSAVDLESFMEIVQNQLGTFINTNNFCLAIYDKDSGSFSLQYYKDEKNRNNPRLTGKNLISYVAKRKKPLFATYEMLKKLIDSGEIENIDEIPQIWVGVPLLLNREVLGVMGLQSYTDKSVYNVQDIKFLMIIAHQISLLIDRKRKEKKLIKALEQAKESDRLKLAFLANMSHEIRTPMNSILGFTDLLQDPGFTEKQKQEFIQIIRKNGNRLLNTVNDIIDISKIETGQEKVTFQEVDVNAILNSMYQSFRYEAKSKGLSLSCNTFSGSKKLLVNTDKHKLESILTNLIKNAIKYTPKGGIDLGCKLISEGEKQFIKFFVTDTGIGIPEKRQKAIFNRFEQADIEDSMALQGSGLGLSISKAYVEMLGGNIWVNSIPSKGSTFYFTIPYSKTLSQHDNTNKTGTAVKHSDTGSKKMKILIVEDDDTSTQLLSIIFQNKDYELFYSKNGKEAVEITRENPDIDVILMDIKIPLIDGYEATRRIRKFNKKVAIVAQTAYALAGDDKKAFEAGCEYHISKPINRIELLNIIEEIKKRKK